MSEFRKQRYPLAEPGCGLTVLSMEGGEINFFGSRVNIKTKICDCCDEIEDGLEYLTADDQTMRNLKWGGTVTACLTVVAGLAFAGAAFFSAPVLVPLGFIAGGAAIFSGSYTGVSFIKDRVNGYCTSEREFNQGLFENTLAGAVTGASIYGAIKYPPARAFLTAQLTAETASGGGTAVVGAATDATTATLVQYYPQISKAVALSSVLFQEVRDILNMATGKGVELAPEENNGVNIEDGDSGTSKQAQYGDNFGKMGKYVENPGIEVDWTKYAEHGAERMQQRGLTKEMIDNIVRNGKVLSQNNGNKFAYITKEGVAIVSKDGKLITAWSSKDFDSSMLEIISRLLGE